MLDPSPATSCPQAQTFELAELGQEEAQGCLALRFLRASLKNLSTSQPQPTALLVPSTTQLKPLCTSAHSHAHPRAHMSLSLCSSPAVTLTLAHAASLSLFTTLSHPRAFPQTLLMWECSGPTAAAGS